MSFTFTAFMMSRKHFNLYANSFPLSVPFASVSLKSSESLVPWHQQTFEVLSLEHGLVLPLQLHKLFILSIGILRQLSHTLQVAVEDHTDRVLTHCSGLPGLPRILLSHLIQPGTCWWSADSSASLFPLMCLWWTSLCWNMILVMNCCWHRLSRFFHLNHTI